MSVMSIARNVACALAVSLSVPSALIAEGARGFFAPVSDRLSFSASVLSGTQGTHPNTMAIGSATIPITGSLTGQYEYGVGRFRDDYVSQVAAGRIFHSYGDRGTAGIYLDYASVDPEHSGRMGLEGTYHFDRFTLEALVGYRFGTNVYTHVFDEIDLTYYASDTLKGSIGHRWTTRGHVANISFEYAPQAMAGWSLFGEAEAGEDDNHSAFAGLRYTFGGARHASLMSRDRNGPMRIRVPRSIVDVTRCGALPKKQSATFGLREMSVLCASRDDLRDEGATENKKH